MFRPADSLIEAVAVASAESWRDVERYQPELFAYVDALRAGGYDVVRRIRAVKRVAGGVPPKLLEQSVKWCIARYYVPR